MIRRSLLAVALLVALSFGAGCVSPPCACPYGYDTSQTIGYHVLGDVKRAFTHRPKQCDVAQTVIVQPAAGSVHEHDHEHSVDAGY